MHKVSKIQKYNIKNNIPIFLSSDNNYAPFVATSIASICDNTKSFCDFYILDGGIEEENKEKICELKKTFNNFSIEFLKIDLEKEFKKLNCKIGSSYITVTTFSRFLIAKLKPNLKKVIYLDVDIIVLGDINDLFNEDLGGHALGAVWNNQRKFFNGEDPKLLDFSNDYKYFNAGVLVIDIQKWNRQNILERLFEIEEKYRRNILHGDESILNKGFDNNYQVLDIKYNYTEWDYKFNVIPKKIYIRHYITKLKPWMINSETETSIYHNIQEFWHYAKMTDFYGDMASKTKIVEEVDKLLHLLKVENLICKANIENAKKSKKNYFISVVNDYNVYDKYITNNKYVNCKNNVLIAFDSIKEGKTIPELYNYFLNNYNYKVDGWFIFCHQDWELLEDITPILEKLDKNNIYGTVGSKSIYYNKKIMKVLRGFCYEEKKDGTQKRALGKLESIPQIVDTLDCQVVIMHSFLVNKYNLRFDENLDWHLYVEDFSINAKLKYDINSYAYSINCCHHSNSGYTQNIPNDYYKCLKYVNKKYPKNIFAGTVSYIGGKDFQEASKIDIIKYIRENKNAKKDFG